MQSEVLVEAAEHHRQLTLLVPPLPVHMPLEPFLGLGKELLTAFDTGNPYQGKLATLVYTADMLETKKVKRVRLIAGLCKVRTSETPKAQQPCLFFSQFQPEFLESIRQALLEPFRITAVLEVQHEIIRKPRQVRLPFTRRLDLLLKPEIKNVVQVDVGQDRAYRPALWRSFLRSRHDSSHHIARFQPFANQAQDDRVCNSMSNHLLQPFMLDVVEVPSDVGLKQVSYL